MELGTALDIIVLFYVVVDSIYLRHSFLEGLEVAIENGVGTCPLRIDQVLDVGISIVAPTADTDVDTGDTGGCRLQVPDVLLVIGLCLLEHINTVLANGLAVGLECAVRIDMDVEEDDVGKARVAELGNGAGTFATDMAANIDAGHFFLRKSIGKRQEDAQKEEECSLHY